VKEVSTIVSMSMQVCYFKDGFLGSLCVKEPDTCQAII
jgi:hypothetical protein